MSEYNVEELFDEIKESILKLKDNNLRSGSRKEELERLKQENRELNAKQVELTDEKKALSEEIEKQKNQNNSLSSENKNLTEKINILTAELEKKERETAPAEETNDLKEELAGIKQERDALFSRLKSIQALLSDYEDKANNQATTPEPPEEEISDKSGQAGSSETADADADEPTPKDDFDATAGKEGPFTAATDNDSVTDNFFDQNSDASEEGELPDHEFIAEQNNDAPAATTPENQEASPEEPEENNNSSVSDDDLPPSKETDADKPGALPAFEEDTYEEDDFFNTLDGDDEKYTDDDPFTKEEGQADDEEFMNKLNS